jgi:hypothetical protein
VTCGTVKLHVDGDSGPGIPMTKRKSVCQVPGEFGF